MKKPLLLFLLLSILCTSFMGCAGINESEPSEHVITKAPFEVPSLFPESDEFLVYLQMCAYDDHPKTDPEIYDSLEVYEEMYIYVDGVKTKLAYVETFLNHYNQLISVNYRDEDGNLYCFRLNGSLLRYTKNYDHHNIDYVEKISMEDAIRSASEFAAKANDAFDPSKLEVKCTETTYDCYIVTYSLLTADNSSRQCCRMEVDYKGEVFSYYNNNSKYEVKDLDTSGIDFDLINELFRSKLDEFYKNILENNLYMEYEFPEEMDISVLEDGRYRISCNVTAYRDRFAYDVVFLTMICPRNINSTESDS